MKVLSSITKNFYVINNLGRAVNRLKNACRALLCLALLLDYFFGVRRPKILLGSKRDQKGRFREQTYLYHNITCISQTLMVSCMLR